MVSFRVRPTLENFRPPPLHAMIKLSNELEIQLLVLLSFTLQLFLFFAGSLRSRSYRGFLRLFIWIAYLGADSVAVYALGLLSRHEKNITTTQRRSHQPLAFFWAPFLLIHLGGQDTISAFSMEDNNLWLRHLLNLVVQIVLAFRVFWRSIRRHGVWLLLAGVLVFVAGIIKYGERTWCLKRGSLKDLESSTRNMAQSTEEINVDASGGYSETVLEALRTMPFVLMIFSASGQSDNSLYGPEDGKKMMKMGRLHLGLMYDELYTKALLLRTRSFMVFRHISQISIVVAFAIFHAIVDKQMFVKADVAITYSLFIGGFFLEVCSMLNFVMSPWTWSMLKGRKWERFASLSWFIFSSRIGWPEKKHRWPSSIGQYNFLSWSTSISIDRPRTTLSQRIVRRVFVDLIGVKEEKIIWMSKVLDTWYVDADEMTLECVAKEIILLDGELDSGSTTRQWTNLGSLLKRLESELYGDFAYAVVHMHILTELHLSKYPLPSDMTTADDGVDSGMVQVCRKLSNYMMHLLVTHPSMLPITTSSAGLLKSCQARVDMTREITREMDEEYDLQPIKETVDEMVYMWTRLLVYAAGKSRKEMHAAQLTSTGGELITFAWLLMAFYRLGDSQVRRVHIINTAHQGSARKAVCAFNITARTTSSRGASSARAGD